MMLQIYMSFSGLTEKKEMGLHAIRSIFVSRGDSLHAWSIRNGFAPMHVFRSIRGDYKGPKAQLAIRMLMQEISA